MTTSMIGTLERAQLLELLQLQDRLNTRIDPRWITRQHPWGRAVAIEGAEAMDHLGWKWWKSQATNPEQFKLELVDIFHFILSDVLQTHQGSAQHAASTFLESLGTRTDEPFLLLGRQYVVDLMTPQSKLDLMIALGALGHTSAGLFAALMRDAGLSWAELRRQYVAKNVLNLLRQDRGYQEGSYIKTWLNEEDNVHLERIMAASPEISAADLYQRLAELYDGLFQPHAA